MVIPGAVYLDYYGILRGLRPVQTGLNSYTKPRWISRVACCFLTRLRAPREKRHDDECIGWRDHGLQVRLVHP